MYGAFSIADPGMRIAIVVNDNFTVWHFFRGLIRALVARDCAVFAICPDGPYSRRIEELGATHVPIAFERFMDPLADLATLTRLTRTLAQLNLDLVANISAKPVVFGAIAARLAGIKRVIGMIEGLGYGFEPTTSWRRRVLRSLVSGLYRMGCRLSDRVGFANHEDRKLFVDSGLLAPEKAIAFRSMIGVNLDEYSPAAIDSDIVSKVRDELDLQSGQLLITMVVARQCWSKGVREFVDAAGSIQRTNPRARFLIVGPLDPKSPEAVPEEYLRSQLGPRFHWIAFSHHIREILHLSTIVVLPSYYREGVPVILLEALAMGKPIITTDNVGCRETVEVNQNGLLVPAKDTAALADAIQRLLLDPALRSGFGRHSRMLAERDFDQRLIVGRVLAMWGLA